MTLPRLPNIRFLNKFKVITPTCNFCKFTLIGAGKTKGTSTGGKGQRKGEPKGQSPTKGKGNPFLHLFCSWFVLSSRFALGVSVNQTFRFIV